MTIGTDLARVLDHAVHHVSELPEDELINLQFLIERAHTHIMIERHLRSRVAPTSPNLRSVT